MRKSMLFTGLLLAVGACQSARLDSQEALAAEKLEIQINAQGANTEVEYHISPDQVPMAVREAMDMRHPGGAYTGAEKEWEKGVMYYELTRTVNGRDVEAMFLPDGTLHQEEIEVPQSEVPAAVQTTARNHGGRVNKWEVIRDSNSMIVEYHVKTTRGGKNYKLMVLPNGTLRAVYREIPAEIEVPE